MSNALYSTTPGKLQTDQQLVRTPGVIASYCGRPEKMGCGFKCNCPICGRHSLSVTYGHKVSLLIHCWNCESTGLDGFTEQREYLVAAGLLDPSQQSTFSPREYAVFCAKRRAEAARLWNHPWYEPVTPERTAAKYLEARGLGAFIGEPVLKCLGGTLLARVDHEQCGLSAVQQTFLLEDGSDRDRSMAPGRKTIGVRKGGAVWIGEVCADEWVVVAEGLETLLSAMLLMDIKCGAAVLGKDFKNLVFPREARRVWIAADNEETGIAAANVAADLWHDQGLKVRVSVPEHEGWDFNNVLLGR